MIVSNHITQLLANERVAELQRHAVASRQASDDPVAGGGGSESRSVPTGWLRRMLQRRPVVPAAVSDER